MSWFTEDYEVAFSITQSLARQELTVAMLLQADKLVQMLESPVFVHVRLQLLNAGSPALAPLLKSLYGLLMILPQSSSYNLLQNRLNGVMPLHMMMQTCAKKECGWERGVRGRELSEKDKQRIALFKEANQDIISN